MTSIYDRSGLRIRELREMHGYTREEFSEMADISSKFLYEIETGQKGFSADTLYRIAKAFSVNCDYILMGNTNLKNNEKVGEILELFSPAQISKICELLKLIHEIGLQ